MPYTDSITSLANATITVTRRGESPRVAGVDQAPVTSTFSLIAVVQPATGEDLQRLPEGRIESKVFAVWVLQELRAAGPPGILADLITWRNEVYEVEHVEPFIGFFNKDHWKVIMRGKP